MHNQVQWNQGGLQSTTSQQTADPGLAAANIADALLNSQDRQRAEITQREAEARQREEYNRWLAEQQALNKAETDRQRKNYIQQFTAKVDRMTQQRNAKWWGKLVMPACVGAAAGTLIFLLINRPNGGRR